MITNDILHQVIKGCIALERESQKLLYSSFYGYAMAVCLRYAPSEEDAMEIVNDGFLKCFKEIAVFRPHYQDHYASFKGWLKKIMIHTAIDNYRKNQKHSNHLELDELIFNMPYTDAQSVDKMSYDEIRKQVQLLSLAYRTVFNLFVVDGYSHEEIAEALHISVGTSKSNLAKAKMNLKKMMAFSDNEIYGRKAV